VQKIKVEKKVTDIVRLANTDLDAKAQLLFALKKIKGISYSIGNCICKVANLNPKTKLKDLTEEQREKLEKIIQDPPSFGIPAHMLNRRKDLETGKDFHLTGADLEMRKKSDIQREIDLKSWKGVRHMFGLPVRGQRTRSSFRKGRAVGVMRKAAKLLMAKGKEKEEKK
jgi:small subunit ribosomal protein S13